jgi:TonB family protein
MNTILAAVFIAAITCAAGKPLITDATPAPAETGTTAPLQFTLTQVVNQHASPEDSVPVEKQPTPLKGHTPNPIYPESARHAGLEGTVWVKLWVDERGNTRKAVVIKSDKEIFNQASIDAAIQWKFDPARLHGKPVAVWVTLPIKFRLDPDGIGKPDSVKKSSKPIPTPQTK